MFAAGPDPGSGCLQEYRVPIGHEEHIYSCESIGCIKGNAVVLFACREFFICLCLALFPISRHVGNFLL